MRVESIKTHLRPYSILQKRKTTINHAFASALAPCDGFNRARLEQAMSMLGETDLENLHCVYCRGGAETWDHLVGLVKAAEFTGFGHQIGNLVPCCRRCNSLKGNMEWRQFLKSAVRNETDRNSLEQMLAAYLKKFAVEIDFQAARRVQTTEWQRYDAIRLEIFKLMNEADELASMLRYKV